MNALAAKVPILAFRPDNLDIYVRGYRCHLRRSGDRRSGTLVRTHIGRVGSGFSGIAHDLLAVEIHEARNRCSLIG